MESDDNRCSPDSDRDPRRDEVTPSTDGSHYNRDTCEVAQGSQCFIATAVYGDINAPEVQVLREFRDNVLRETGIGRLAIQIYYSGAGAKTANFISEHAPSTIPLIRKGLDYLVQRYQAE